ncbi:N-acetyltransferase family protein [Rubneribacter sp.]|nr:GNAT family N-acetyltransferase [Candidatus Rubneribacter avistercoris]
MEFAVATEEHLDRLCEMTDQAKRRLRDLGIDQWQQGYPSRETWARDIEEGSARVAVENGAVLGVLAFKTGADPSYGLIDGAWLTSGDYASLHRVCVAGESVGAGVAGALFAHAFQLARDLELPSVRIDTHPGNRPMLRALEKAGFARCGQIRLVGGLEDGALRIAFEKVLA